MNRSDIPSPADVPIFILAGGLGTRIAEETQLRPKPMVEIGGIPILAHIMRSYYAHGFNDFVICAGYKGQEIKKFFLDYRYNLHDLEIDNRSDSKEVRTAVRERNERRAEERWRVRVIDTGPNTQTGARVARAFDIVSVEQKIQHFGLTYGDGVSDADLTAELRYHCGHQRTGTVLGVKNLARYGELDVQGEDRVSGFLEKPEMRQGFISGGFFFFKAAFRSYLDVEEGLIMEREPLAHLAKDDQLRVFKHTGFWAAMDTLRDRNHLQSLWDSGRAPWAPKKEDHETNNVSDGRYRAARRRAG